MPSGWDLLDGVRQSAPSKANPWSLLDSVSAPPPDPRAELQSLWAQQEADLQQVQSGTGPNGEISADAIPAAQRAHARAKQIADLNRRLPPELQVTGVQEPLRELGIMEGLGRGLQRGAYGMVQSVGGLVRGVNDAMLQADIAAAEKLGVLSDPSVQAVISERQANADAIASAQTATRDRMQALRPSASVEQGGAFQPTNPRWYTERTAEVVPQLGAQIGMAMATGGFSVPAQVASFAATGGVMEAGATYEEAVARLRKQGMSEREAVARAMVEAGVVGGVNTAIETIPGSAILQKSGGQTVVRPLVGKIVRSALSEGAEEASQNFVGDAARRVIENDPRAFDDWKSRYAGAATIGGLAGGLAGGVLEGADVSSEAFARAQIEAAKRRLQQSQGAPPQSPAQTPTTGAPSSAPPAGSPPVPTSQPQAAPKSGQPDPSRDMAAAFYGSADTASAWAQANPKAAEALVNRKRHSMRAFLEADPTLPKLEGQPGDAAARMAWLDAVRATFQQPAPVANSPPANSPTPQAPAVPDSLPPSMGDTSTTPATQPVVPPNVAQPVDNQQPIQPTPPTPVGDPAVMPSDTSQPAPQSEAAVSAPSVPVTVDGASTAGGVPIRQVTPVPSEAIRPVATESSASADSEPDTVGPPPQTAPVPAVTGVSVPTIQQVSDLYREINPDINPTAAAKNAQAMVDVITSWKYGAIVDPYNKSSRKVFERITGIALPNTTSGTRAVFDSPRGAITNGSATTPGAQVPNASTEQVATPEVSLGPGNVETMPPPVATTATPTMSSPVSDSHGGGELGGTNTAASAPRTPTPPTTAPASSAPIIPTAAKPDTPDVRLSSSVAQRLDAGESIDAKTFFADADREYGSTRAAGGYGPSDAYDALELGVNRHIQQMKPEAYTPAGTASKEQAVATAAKLNELIDRIPSQTNRSGEKDAMQQFSTPPAYAYLANWVAQPGPGDVMLEPSAGTGNLALHGALSGSRVVGNELSKRRAELLGQLPIERVLNEDAEQLHNILPTVMQDKPTVVVMNPPFSRAAHRLGDKMVVGTDTKHIDAALKTMADGGRLVAIVGAGLHGPSKTFSRWLDGLPWSVKAAVEMERDVYRGYGTTFPTRLLVIDKVPKTATDSPAVTGTAATIQDAFNLLENVRNERPQPTSAQPSGPRAPRTNGGPSGRQQPGSGAEPGGMAAGQPSGGGAAPDVRASRPPADDRPADSRVQAPDGNASAPAPGRGDDPGRGESGTPGATPPVRGDSDAAANGGQPVGESGRQPPAVDAASGSGEGRGGLSQDQEPRQKDQKKTIITEEVYEPYHPRGVGGLKAQPHPAEIVESAAMAAVPAPKLTYVPTLPPNVVESGALSDVQLEAVAAAGQAHSKSLRIGDLIMRMGFLIGDGTGVGKGREIAGIILDNWLKGRKKAVWISVNAELFPSAVRDWTALSGTKEQMIQLSDFKSGTAVTAKEGVMYATYGILFQEASAAAVRNGNDKSRLQQLVDWLGPDFDGVIAFDEAHKMGSAIDIKGNRGIKKASKQAISGSDLQKALPNARIVYVSATSATESHNLAYAQRLGLWGKGTAFANVLKFIEQITRGGVSMMEQVAADMKAMGAYLSRNISFRGVKFERMTHGMSDSDTKTWDTLSDAWQVVLANIDEALQLTEADGRAKGRATSVFWRNNMAFWERLLQVMVIPDLLKDMHSALDRGESCVIQFTSTGEADQEAAAAELEEGDDLDALDMSPRRLIMAAVEKGFPVVQYEDYLDPETNTMKKRPVVDANGNKVLNQEAVRMRDALLDTLGSLPLGDRTPMDMIIDEFGSDAVAEVTGRKRRFVAKKPGGKIEQQKRGDKAPLADIDDFQAEKKRILLFSGKGNTGASYHADLTKPNQQLRRHYLLQAGWRADGAIQGFGRTHRSNQKQPPVYVLLETDLKGQKRFISTIARRLAQLGAITKGQREAGESGMFTAADNLESFEAKDALRTLFKDIVAGRAAISLDDFTRVSGLTLVDDNGSIREDLPPVTKFLNRVLNMNVGMQNKVFQEFESRIEQKVRIAKENGTLSQGMETIRAERVEKVSEQTVYTHDNGSVTRHLKFRLLNKVKPISWTQVQNVDKPDFYVRSVRTGKVFPAQVMNVSETDRDTGVTSERVRLHTPFGWNAHNMNSLGKEQYWTRATEQEAQASWEEQIADKGEFHERVQHMISGIQLPIWDRLSSTGRLVRIQDDSGDVHIGRNVDEDAINDVLTALGVNGESRHASPEQVLRGVEHRTAEYRLANGWKLKHAMVQGESRIELLGPDNSHMGELKADGVFTERINFKTRFFIPLGQESLRILTEVMQSRPVVDIVSLVKTGPSFGTTGGGEMRLETKRNPRGLVVPDAVLIDVGPVEDRMSNAFSQTKPSMLDSLTEWVSSFGRAFRPQEWLREKDTEMAGSRDVLRTVPRAQQRAFDKMARIVSEIVDPLNADEYHLFNRVLILRDVRDGIEAGERSVFGFGVDGNGEYDANRALDDLERNLARLEALVAANPTVATALQRREDARESLVRELIEAGQLPEEIARNPKSYFHRQVVAYQQSDRFAEVSVAFKKRRSFQKKRVKGEGDFGAEYDYNSNYLEAEIAWMTDAATGMALEQAYQEAVTPHDIIPQLKEHAKTANFVALVGGPKNAARIQELKELIRTSREMDGNDSDARKQRAAWIEERMQLDPTYPYDTRIAQLLEELTIEHPELASEHFDEDEKAKFLNLVRSISRDNNDPSVAIANSLLKSINDKRQMIETALGDAYVTWQDLADTEQGYVVWTPTPGNSFFRAWTVPERAAEQFIQGLSEDLQVEPEQVKQVLAMGGARNQVVIPERLANQLDTLQKEHARSSVVKLVDFLNASWKRTILLAPWRIVGYEMRNFLGDMDPVLAVGDKSLIVYAKSAFDELKLFYRQTPTSVHPRTLAAHNLEVLDSGITATDMADLRELPAFEHLFDSVTKSKGGISPIKVARWYFENAEKVSKIREGTLRLAVFNWLLDNHIKTGKFPTYGASYPEAVDAIEQALGRERAAAKIARELLGDYGDVSQIGQWLARTLVPFWRFQEINMRRYPRLIANAWRQGGKSKAAGMAGRWAMREAVGNTLRIGLGWAVFKLLSMLNAPEEEKKLPEYVQNNPHLTLGKKADGSTLVINNVGSLGDFLEWGGLNDLPTNIGRWMDGQVSGDYVPKEMARSFANKLYGMVGPMVKAPFEIGFGMTGFPDVFNRRPMNRDEYAASQVSLTDEYKLARGFVLGDGSSVRPFWYLRWLGVTLVNTNKAALDDIHAARTRWLKEQGETPSNAMALSRWQRVKDALVNQDYDAFRDARKAAIQHDDGDTGKAFEHFIEFVKKLDPVENRISEDKERAFIDWLNGDEREKLHFARQYAAEMGDLGITWWETASRQDDQPRARDMYRKTMQKQRANAIATMQGRGSPQRQKGESATAFQKRKEEFSDRQQTAKRFLNAATPRPVPSGGGK